MSDEVVFAISVVPASARTTARSEVCEHKGIGHPDSICDGVAEAVSQALCRAYLGAYGEVQHHNVDKGLLIAGRSVPRFGGGKVTAPIRLIIGGRAAGLPAADLREIVCRSAREHLAATLRCSTDLFSIESAVGEGSADLREVFSRGGSARLANDTSFGAGYAPYSELEQKTLQLARILRSSEFRRAFAAAGDDYKIMGTRVERQLRFTVALAFVDRQVAGVRDYFDIKAEAVRYLAQAVDEPDAIDLNALDDPNAGAESGIYLTVTGLSAEQGDDGQVGRGNRVSGLITPCRTMSLEAAAGKNPVAHVGKLYNVLALQIARRICAETDGILEASVRVVSTIGRPINEPQLVSIEVVAAGTPRRRDLRRIEMVARSCLDRIGEIPPRLIAGEIPVF